MLANNESIETRSAAIVIPGIDRDLRCELHNIAGSIHELPGGVADH